MKNKCMVILFAVFFLSLSLWNVFGEKETFSESERRVLAKFPEVSFVTERIPLVSAEAVYYLKSYTVLLGAGIVGVTPVMKVFAEKIMDFKSTLSKVIAYAEPVVLVVLVIFVTAYLVDGSFNPFLYFRF